MNNVQQTSSYSNQFKLTCIGDVLPLSTLSMPSLTPPPPPKRVVITFRANEENRAIKINLICF